jgi:hypothetical protein
MGGAADSLHWSPDGGVIRFSLDGEPWEISAKWIEPPMCSLSKRSNRVGWSFRLVTSFALSDDHATGLERLPRMEGLKNRLTFRVGGP